MHIETIRQLFEQNTTPNFPLVDLSRNDRGEYVNAALEDHWQTYQECAETIITASVAYLKEVDCDFEAEQLEAYWEDDYE